MQALVVIFWGLLVLSILVFFHEGGHYLAARLFNVRVTEFFLGMPFRLKLSHKSKRYGTEIGVTPLLLGGYTRICGMEANEDPLLAASLAYVQEHGRVSAEALAKHVSIDVDRAYQILATLSDWASIRPFYDAEKGEYPNQKVFPESFETLARDSSMLTEYDLGHDFSKEGASKAGEARPITSSAEAFLEEERSHTYLGCSYLQRLFMLVAGPLVNLIVALVIVCSTYMVVGTIQIENTNVLGDVAQGSYAEKAGIVPGDAIVSINGNETLTWYDVIEELDIVLNQGGSFDLVFEHDGTSKTATIVLDHGGPDVKLGIFAKTSTYYPSFFEALHFAFSYAYEVASFALRLIIPTHTMEVLEQSSSVVGISVMAAEAAQSSFADLVLLMGAVSMSLCFMNLLPIPPLDGGKMLIETIQALIGKPLSQRAQAIVSYVGLAFFLFIFVFALRNDLMRLL